LHDSGKIFDRNTLNLIEIFYPIMQVRKVKEDKKVFRTTPLKNCFTTELEGLNNNNERIKLN